MNLKKSKNGLVTRLHGPGGSVERFMVAQPKFNLSEGGDGKKGTSCGHDGSAALSSCRKVVWLL